MTKLLLRRSEAAEYLQQQYGLFTTQTLAKLATIGGGPLFIKLGRFPLYRREDLDTWANDKMSKPVRSTSELNCES